MRKTGIAAALAAVLIVSGPAAQADSDFGDPEAGRLVAGMCRTCHGLNGVARNPAAPNIAGESVAYLTAQIEAFRSGARVNEMMTVVAGSLTEPQIADVTAWFALLKPTVSPPPGRDPADAPAACADCHGADGLSLIEAAPNLAGENEIYILTQLKAFRSGKRVHEVMSAVAADMTDNEMRAAAAWYAAIGVAAELPQ